MRMGRLAACDDAQHTATLDVFVADVDYRSMNETRPNPLPLPLEGRGRRAKELAEGQRVLRWGHMLWMLRSL